MLVTWTLYGLQVLFAVVSLIAIGFFCFSFEWFDLVISIFFMAVSRHVYWLKLKYKKQFVEGVTNFTKHGAFGNLNRRGRKTMERYFKKLRKFNR